MACDWLLAFFLIITTKSWLNNPNYAFHDHKIVTQTNCMDIEVSFFKSFISCAVYSSDFLGHSMYLLLLSARVSSSDIFGDCSPSFSVSHQGLDVL